MHMQNDTNFIAEIDAFVAENTQAMIADIARLVKIPSVEGVAAPEAPFGKEVKKALDLALEMARELGLHTVNVDNKFGFADLAGESEKQIAAIAHLDVVPAGNGWTQDPFTLTVRDGYVIGRGVSDDKGPLITLLYLAKFFKERGAALPYTLRLLFGTNEETGMLGLEHYQAQYADPAFCFTPDADFPVCNGEKGIFGGELRSARLTGNLLDFSGGIASNVVPDRATALLRADIAGLKKASGLTFTAENGAVRICAFGKGGHAASPAHTVNAIGLIVNYLLDNALCSAAENRYLQLLQKLFCCTDGSGLGIAASDDKFTPLTCIGGIISLKDGVLSQNINIRYPTTTSGADITAKLDALCSAFDASFVPERDVVPFYVSADSAEVQTLVHTYNEVTGRDEKPFTIGGGTYARHFKNAVSFGLEGYDKNPPAFVGPMHGADEGIAINTLATALKIYILSVARLMLLDF